VSFETRKCVCGPYWGVYCTLPDPVAEFGKGLGVEKGNGNGKGRKGRGMEIRGQFASLVLGG